MKNKTILKIAVLTLLLAALVFAAVSLSSCKHTHKYGDINIIVAPTCSSEGVQEMICDCGAIVEAEIAKIDHTPGDWVVVLEATCTAGGYDELSCRECDTLVDTRSTAALGHDIVKVPALAPTCAEVGHTEHESCTRCSHSTYEEIAKLPHTPGAAADCENSQNCLVCESVIVPALGHKEIVTEGKEATCMRAGTTDLVSCSTCGKVVKEQIEVPKRAHVLSPIKEIAATCTNKGQSAGVECLTCGIQVVKPVVIPRANHVYTNDLDSNCNNCGQVRVTGCKHEETVEITSDIERASCTRYGLSSGKKCKSCGYITTTQKIVEAKDHTVRVVEGYPATPISPGLTDGEHCMICLVVIKQQEIIPVIGSGESEAPAPSSPTEPEGTETPTEPTTPSIPTVSAPDDVQVGTEFVARGTKLSASEVNTWNKKIGEAMSGVSMKINEVEVDLNYGVKTTTTSESIYDAKNNRMLVLLEGDGYSSEAVYDGSYMYSKTELFDGSVTKQKMPIGLDAIGSMVSFVELAAGDTAGLGADIVLTAEKLSNGNTVIYGKGFDIEWFGKDFLDAFSMMGAELEFNQDRCGRILTVDSNGRILKQELRMSMTISIGYAGTTTQMVRENTTVSEYTYGDYTVNLPADAASYDSIG